MRMRPLNHDENVNLAASAWRTWAKHWLEIGLTPDHHDVIGGLVQTMADNGATWCDRCQLVAQHHKDAPKTDMNATSRVPCPLHSRVDAAGNCQACQPNSIATANQC